jgi:hypothetical protein
MDALEQLLREMYDAVNAAMASGEQKEIERLIGPYVTDDFVLRPSETLLDGKVSQGVPAVAEWLATMSFSDVRWVLGSVAQEDDETVVTTGTVSVHGQASGAAGIAAFEHRITLRDGRVAELHASIPSNVE